MRRPGAALSALTATTALAVTLLTSCGTGSDDKPEPERLRISVSPGTAIDASVAGATLSAAKGSVAGAGTLRVETGTRTTGLSYLHDKEVQGVDVSFEKTRLTKPVTVTFDPPAGKAPEDGIPVVLHETADAMWEVEPAEVDDEGRFSIRTQSFSFRAPAWLDPREFLASVWDSAVDATFSRTDPDACDDPKPKWAKMEKKTTLVHACLLTNKSKSGAERAEVKLKANRRFYTKVSVPGKPSHRWVEDGDSWVLDRASGIPELLRGNEVLLPPQTRMSAGYPLPATDQALTFTTYVDTWTIAISQVSSILSVLGFDDRRGFAAAWVLYTCGSEVPRDLDDPDGWAHFTACAMFDALPQLDDPDKATSAAASLYNGDPYQTEAAKDLEKAGKALKLLGKIVKIVGIVAWLRDIFMTFPDEFSELGNDRTGDVELRLTGNALPAAVGGGGTKSGVNTAGWVIHPDGVGPFRIGMSATEAVDTGEAAWASRPCGDGPVFRRTVFDPSAGEDVLFWNWDSQQWSGKLSGVFVKYGGHFSTAKGIGIGSTRTDLQRAYGDRLISAAFEFVIEPGSAQFPVLYGTRGALVFLMEKDRVDSMQVVPGRPGQTLKNIALGC